MKNFFDLHVVRLYINVLLKLCLHRFPGPKWYPFLGCGTLVENTTKELGSQLKAFAKLSKEYSTQTLGLKLGRDLVVVVFGEKNIKQVFTGKEFEGRPDTYFLRLRCFGKRLGEYIF